MSTPEIPGFRIKKVIGSGGMATVYLAEQLGLKRDVALKVMAPVLSADADFGRRFENEAITNANLIHANIVTIFGVGTAGDLHYIAMEYFPGGDLKTKIRQGVSKEDILAIIEQIASALAPVHKKGLVHRDIKPENILFREDNTCVLADFGIATAVNAATRLTGVGMVVGSPHYMSPEQAQGKKVDNRSDLYSLGIVLYEMMSGEIPYDAENTVAIAFKHVNDPVPNLPKRHAALQPLLDRLLAKEPGDRFQSAGDLIKALEPFHTGRTGETETVKPPEPSDREKGRAAAGATQLMPAKKKPASKTTIMQTTPKPTAEAAPQSAGKKRSRWLVATALILVVGMGATATLLSRDKPKRPGLPGGGLASTSPSAPSPPPAPTPDKRPAALARLPKPPEQPSPSTSAATTPVPVRYAARKAQRRIATIMTQGKAALEAGRYEAARKAANQVLVDEPGHAGATDLFKKIQSKLDPEANRDSEIKKILVEGKNALYAKQYDRAAALAAKALTMDKENREAVNLDKAADRERKKAIDQYLAAGRSEAKAGKYLQAAASFQKILSIDPGNSSASRQIKALAQGLVNSAEEQIQDGKIDKAKILLAKACELNPADSVAKQKMLEIKNANGILDIYCEPWGKVVIDGNDIERIAPCSDIRLPIGRHVIHLLNPEEATYGKRSMEVSIEKNKKVKLIAIGDKVIIKKN